MLAAIWSTCAGEWVRALLANGISRSIGQRSTLSAGHGIPVEFARGWDLVIDEFVPVLPAYDHAAYFVELRAGVFESSGLLRHPQ